MAELAANFIRLYVREKMVDIHDINHREHAVLYEAVAAITHHAFLWFQLPPAVLQAFGAPRYKKGKSFPDYGIDCATIDFQLVIQAKWYSSGSAIRFRDMATFMLLARDVIRPSDDRRMMLVRPTDSKLAFAVDLIRNLEHDFMDDNDVITVLNNCIQSDDVISTPVDVRLPFVLRPYQNEAVAVIMACPAVKRISMACGTGKTIVMAEVVRMTAGRILIICPYILLMQQISEVITRHTGEVIARVGGGYAEDSVNTRITICVYNSIDKLDGLFDMMIVDESHHIDYDTEVKHARRDSIMNIRADLCVLMTATPRKTSDYVYALTEAIENGDLCDYHIAVPVVPSADRLELRIATLISQHIEWMHVLAYCNSISAAEYFTELLCSIGVPAKTFNGKTGNDMRGEILQEFRDGTFRVLVTVGVLCEGIDIPIADTCVFVDPRNSSIDVMQCVGRVLRRCRGKLSATVVLPSSIELDVLSKFLTIMSKMDHRLSGKTSRELIGRVDTVRALLYDDPIGVLNILDQCELEIYDRFGNMVTECWDKRLQLLSQFIAENGRLPKQREKVGACAIGRWIDTNRMVYKTGKMPGDRIAALENIPEWQWRVTGTVVSWDEIYKILSQFVAENGRLPKRRDKAGDCAIGSWIDTNRRVYKTGKLSVDRIMALENIPGWLWAVRTSRKK